MIVSRIALIAASIVVGIVLAVGAAFTASSVLSSPGAPVNRPNSYGSP
jgi:hypothetical protein